MWPGHLDSPSAPAGVAHSCAHCHAGTSCICVLSQSTQYRRRVEAEHVQNYEQRQGVGSDVDVPGDNETGSHRLTDGRGPEYEHSRSQEYDPTDVGFEAMDDGDDEEGEEDNDEGLDGDEPPGPLPRHPSVDRIDSNAAEAARQAAEEHATGHDQDMGPLTETERATLIALLQRAQFSLPSSISSVRPQALTRSSIESQSPCSLARHSVCGCCSMTWRCNGSTTTSLLRQSRRLTKSYTRTCQPGTCAPGMHTSPASSSRSSGRSMPRTYYAARAAIRFQCQRVPVPAAMMSARP